MDPAIGNYFSTHDAVGMTLETLQMEEDSITERNLPHLSEKEDHEVAIGLTEKNVRPKALRYNFKLAELRLPDAKDLTRQRP